MNKPGDYVMPFGKYKGKTLDQIASTDDGLRYLDWAVDAFSVSNDVSAAIEAFLDDPVVKRELADLVGEIES